jgi:predicted amidohydrolase
MLAHLVQLDIAWEDPGENHRRARRLIEQSRPSAGDLVVLPEMFDTGFSFNLEKTADREGRTLEFLRGLARDLGIYLQGARTVLGADGRGRNRATIVDPLGNVACEYDKVHPFSFGRESQFFSGGGEVVTYAWKAGGAVGDASRSCLVCPAICYDLRFPELFRLGMLRGAEVFALGANWPAPRKAHREALSIARAIENQAYMLCVNRAGRDPSLSYEGGTIAVGPRGEVLGRLEEGEGVLRVAIDLPALRQWRSDFPATRDVRLIGR